MVKGAELLQEHVSIGFQADRYFRVSLVPRVPFSVVELLRFPEGQI